MGGPSDNGLWSISARGDEHCEYGLDVYAYLPLPDLRRFLIEALAALPGAEPALPTVDQIAKAICIAHLGNPYEKRVPPAEGDWAAQVKHQLLPPWQDYREMAARVLAVMEKGEGVSPEEKS